MNKIFYTLLIVLIGFKLNAQEIKAQDSIIVNNIVNDFFTWYITSIKEKSYEGIMPSFVEMENGMTTLDFSFYFENLKKYKISDDLIEIEKKSYQECLYHLEKTKYVEFKANWTDIDDFADTNCDFGNSYRWIGGMEPVDYFKVITINIIENKSGIVEIEYRDEGTNNQNYYRGAKTVTLIKENDLWLITRIE